MNTGRFDPLDQLVPIAHERGAWIHVDGAFGIWAAAVPSLRGLMRGHARRRFVVDRRPQVAQRAVRLGDRLRPRRGGPPRRDDPRRRVLRRDRRRRARRLQLDAGIVASGARVRGPRRAAVAGPVRAGRPHRSRLSAWPAGWPTRLAADPRVSILNEVVLNQVLVRFEGPDDDPDGSAGDTRTRDVIADVQRDGTCWLGGSTWQGRAAMPDLGLRLADDRGRHRPVRGGDPGVP